MLMAELLWETGKNQADSQTWRCKPRGHRVHNIEKDTMRALISLSDEHSPTILLGTPGHLLE